MKLQAKSTVLLALPLAIHTTAVVAAAHPLWSVISAVLCLAAIALIQEYAFFGRLRSAIVKAHAGRTEQENASADRPCQGDEMGELHACLDALHARLQQAEASLHEIEAESRSAETRIRFLSQAVEQSSNSVMITDLQGRIQYVNNRYLQVTGYSREEVLGQNPRLLKSGVHPNSFYGQLWATVKSGLEWHGDICNRKKNGDLCWESLSITPIRDPEGEITNFLAIKEDITERKRSEETLRYAALHDALTGLPNRSLLMEHLTRSVARHRRHPERKFAIMFLDFDRFKLINDSLGHRVGDELLVAIGERLRTCLRTTDVVSGPDADGEVARLGGDEFIILLDDIKDVSDATEVAERIQQSMATPFRLDRHEVHVTVSIGIVTSDGEYEHPEDIIRDADTAMFEAKSSGRARHVLFDRHMHEQAAARLELENDLRRALERNELSVSYQPIISLADGRLRGFEALARWHHPRRGQVPPVQFITICEETGLIVPIGLYVLETACRTLMDWRTRLPELPPICIDVNLSKRQLIEPDLVERVNEVLRRTGMSSDDLELELTESAIVEQPDLVVPVLTQLKNAGFRLAMDDFGTGHSSLSCLRRFPIDVLKIDRTFINSLTGPHDHRGEQSAILQAIVSLAHNLGLSIIAEGIETPAQLRHLRSLRCDYGQGYLFAKPMPATAALEFAAERIRAAGQFSPELTGHSLAEVTADA